MLYSFDGKQPRICKDSHVSDIAIVIGNIIVGESTIIAEGCVVKMRMNIPDRVVMAGNPAKEVR